MSREKAEIVACGCAGGAARFDKLSTSLQTEAETTTKVIIEITRISSFNSDFTRAREIRETS
jgi:thiamine pyrophosphokinase